MSSVLNPICRGLVGHMSYLASCRASTIYSEYLLYEPFCRIAQSQGYSVRCEVPVPEADKGHGDKKRIDFVLKRRGTSERMPSSLSVEVKWVRSRSIDIQRDVDKLNAYREVHAIPGYVLLFGRIKNDIWVTKARQRPLSQGKLVEWGNGKTSYAAQWIRYA